MLYFGFFEESRGPGDMTGVSLHYVLNRRGIAERYVKLREEEKVDYWTPHIDWWKSKKDYVDGKTGFCERTIGYVQENYPDFYICKDRATAVKFAHMSPEEAEEKINYSDLDWELIGCYTS